MKEEASLRWVHEECAKMFKPCREETFQREQEESSEKNIRVST